MAILDLPPNLQTEWVNKGQGVTEQRLQGGYIYSRVEEIQNALSPYQWVVRGWNKAIAGEAQTMQAAQEAAETCIFDILNQALDNDFPLKWQAVDGQEDNFDSFHVAVANNFIYVHIAPYGKAETPRYSIDIRGWGEAMSHSEASLEQAKQKAQAELKSLIKVLLNEA